VSRKRSQKPNPDSSAPQITVTKRDAAFSQLETAIWIWFTRDDPISVLGLAKAANDCYDAMGAHEGKPSFYRTWLKAQPQTYQDRANYVANFIKHGWKDLTESTPYSPRQGEVLIVDSIDCHRRYLGK
jgi:hypothetical protein